MSGRCNASITVMAIVIELKASTTDIKTIALYIPNQLSAMTAPMIANKDDKNA